MVNVTVKHGTTDASALAYSGFGVMLGPIFHRYRDGERFTKLAIDVAEKYGFSDRRVGPISECKWLLCGTIPLIKHSLSWKLPFALELNTATWSMPATVLNMR
jgi:hypothetical protein